MKFLIFKSKVTQAVYSFNGVNVVTISNSDSRPVGRIMHGLDNKFLDKIYQCKGFYFHIGDAEYEVLTRLYLLK